MILGKKFKGFHLSYFKENKGRSNNDWCSWLKKAPFKKAFFQNAKNRIFKGVNPWFS